MSEVTVPEIKKDVVPEKTPQEKMVEALKEYPFIEYSAGMLKVTHPELPPTVDKETSVMLGLKIINTGDIVTRGIILASYNGGATNIDPQTLALNNCLATVRVGFTPALKIDLLKVEDTALIMGLWLAISSYQAFFRRTPLGIDI
jgi:hypothetical protein